jgi:hypothetical protein
MMRHISIIAVWMLAIQPARAASNCETPPMAGDSKVRISDVLATRKRLISYIWGTPTLPSGHSVVTATSPDDAKVSCLSWNWRESVPSLR